jgi:DHA2 family multidrug resistance protein
LAGAYLQKPDREPRVLSNGNLRVGTILSFILGFGLYGSTFIIPLVYPGYIGLDGDTIGDAYGTRGDRDCDDDAGCRSAAATWRETTVSRSARDDILFRLQLLGIPDPLARYRKDAFFNMLIVRGIGLGIIVCTHYHLALSTLKGREIGEGAAFTGMMRQLGGSFGVAVITTFIAGRIWFIATISSASWTLIIPLCSNALKGFNVHL